MSVYWRYAECAHCGRMRGHSARNLCKSCVAGCNGCDPLDYPRLTWSSQDLAGDYHVLRLRGLTQRQAAVQLGVTHAALDKALDRSGYRRRFSGTDLTDLRRIA